MHYFVGNLFRCRPKSAKNYKIRLRFHKDISIYNQANGNVQFFGPPCMCLCVNMFFMSCVLL